MATDGHERQEETFANFISPEKWKDFESHAKTISQELSRDVALSATQNEKIQKEVREYLEKEYEICKVNEEGLTWAEEKLYSSQVCAVDGTHSTYPMLSGIRCRIGVAATSYRNKRTDGIVFVSEQHLHPSESSVLEILKSRKTENRLISGLLIRAIMFYMERKIALDRQEEWLMFNGPLVPFELRSGIGRMRALDPCLSLCEKIIDRKTIVGVVAKSTEDEIVSLGLALKPLEYLKLRSFKDDLEDWLPKAHFNTTDEERFRRFIDSHGPYLDIGLYKAGNRAYIFHAHQERFHEAAALIIRDSLFQPMRAYPLLIDYSDSLCTYLLASSDFRRMVDFKLANVGSLTFEQSEIDQRRR
jgi:hypothetical protein